MLEQIEKFASNLHEQALALAPDAAQSVLSAMGPTGFFVVLLGVTLFLAWSVFALLKEALTLPSQKAKHEDQEDEEPEPPRRSRERAPEPAGRSAFYDDADEPLIRTQNRAQPGKISFGGPGQKAQPQPAPEPARAPQPAQHATQHAAQSPPPRDAYPPADPYPPPGAYPQRAAYPAPPAHAPTAPPQRAAEPDLSMLFDQAMIRGDRAAAAGDHYAAREAFRDALDAARRHAFAAAGDPRLQHRVARALLKMGDANLRLSDRGAAHQQHEQALALLRRLYASDPYDLGLARDFAVTLERCASALAAQGDRTSARILFEEELRVVGSVSERIPEDMQWLRFRAVVHVMLGNLAGPDSRRHYYEAHRLFQMMERTGALHQGDRDTLGQLRHLLGAA